jgi:hypothetical protein
MRSGDCPGLQNRRMASSGVIDGFDSHSLPPMKMQVLRLAVLAQDFATRLRHRVTGSSSTPIRFRQLFSFNLRSRTMAC